MTPEITKLRTVEEISREAHIHWLQKSATAQLKGQGELTVLPYGYLGQAITETITQDRQQLLDAVCGVLDGMKRVRPEYLHFLSDEEVDKLEAERMAEERVLEKAKTTIKNLLDDNK